MPYTDPDRQREAVREAKQRFDARAAASRIIENKESLRLDGWDLKALNRGNHSAEKKIGIVTAWVTGSSLQAASLHFDVPYPLVRTWKHRGVWWDEAVEKVRNDHNEDLDTYMTGVMDKATKALSDRIEHGDYKYDSKIGENVRVPMQGKDLAVVTAIYTEKRALLRGEATSISITKQDPLKDIESKLKEFAKFSAARQLEGEALVVKDKKDSVELGSAAELLTQSK